VIPIKGSELVLRIWRDRTGSAIAKARFLEERDHFVVLEDRDRQEIKMSTLNLSNIDIDYIQSMRIQLETSSEPHQVEPLEARTETMLERTNLDATSTLSDTETVEVPLMTRPNILVGKRTHLEPKWRYRTQATLPSPVRLVGKDTDETLPSAAARGDISEVKRLLRLGYNIETTGCPWSQFETETTGSGEANPNKFPETTAPYRAAGAGHLDVARYLLEQGANVNTQYRFDHRFGEPLLFTTVKRHDENMTRLLLEYNAMKDRFRSGQNVKTSMTSLHVACSYPKGNIVRLLLDYNASIDAVDSESQTPLYVAAKLDHASIVKLLLEEGAACNTIIKDGQSPLYKAVGRGHLDVVRYLLRY
jgi:hypothetical protein